MGWLPAPRRIGCQAWLSPPGRTAEDCRAPLQVRPSERIAAAQQLERLEAVLRAEVRAQGGDPDAAAQVSAPSPPFGSAHPAGALICLALKPSVHTNLRCRCTRHRLQVEDDGAAAALEGDIAETGVVDAETGQLLRPWCPATRLLEHREAAAEAAAAEAQRRSAQAGLLCEGGGLGGAATGPPPRLCFPPLVEGERVYQKNEGGGAVGRLMCWWLVAVVGCSISKC